MCNKIFIILFSMYSFNFAGHCRNYTCDSLAVVEILNSNEVCKRVISDIVGSYETFSDFYSNSSDQKLMASTLVECNILTTQEIPSFYSDQGFTTEGKELIENLLAGLVLSKPALIIADNRVKNFRRIIITSLPILTANYENKIVGADYFEVSGDTIGEVRHKVKLKMKQVGLKDDECWSEILEE